ncbi:hypothetical protein LINPERHAP2_LOCUS28946, partial [Linum perenne]
MREIRKNIANCRFIKVGLDSSELSCSAFFLPLPILLPSIGRLSAVPNGQRL